MEMKYYNPSNNFSAPIKREPKPYMPPRQKIPEVVIPKVPEYPVMQQTKESQIEVKKEKHYQIDVDDILIMGLILILIANQCDDYLLLAALGFLLFSGKGKA